MLEVVANFCSLSGVPGCRKKPVVRATESLASGGRSDDSPV